MEWFTWVSAGVKHRIRLSAVVAYNIVGEGNQNPGLHVFVGAGSDSCCYDVPLVEGFLFERAISQEGKT